ncbi:MAG: hypothetical protein WC389_18580 [Lutibacter sp.]|jgi:hypothetical protein
MNDKRFLNIPVPMMKDLHINSKGFFSDVFDVGIYLYSKTLKGSEEKCYRDALKFLGITQGNIKTGISNAKRILCRMPEKYPIVGIEKNMLFDYYKNEKSDFDIICLGTFLGIRSILGTKQYCKTNKALIHARLFGYITAKELPAKLTPIEKKYQIRWHMDKVLIELQTNWFLKLISNHQRGMYISFDLSLDELAVKSEANKQLSKIKQFKETKRKAIENAKAQLTTH